MKRIEKVRSLAASADGVQQVVADIQVSTVDDLPGESDTVGGCKILPGSIAQVVQTGEFYTLDDDGEWYASGAE